MADYFENETNEKSLGFRLMLGLIAFMLASIGLSMLFVINKATTENIPIQFWYPYTVVGLSVLAIIGTIFIYFYRKIGVFLVPICILLMIMLNPEQEFTLLKTLVPIFTLFVYVGYGLVVIIPKWKFFK